jgi:putative nucleotidyltransferase-like protein
MLQRTRRAQSVIKANKTLAITRPEDEMLICIARAYLDPERAEQFRALVHHGLDWDYVLRSAEWHGVVPLLYWHLNSLCQDIIPEIIRDRLHDYFFKNSKTNLLLTGELLKILCMFDAEGISAIPFKGPTLAASVYGNLALREFCDLDILIQEKDVKDAKALMLSQGYVPQFRLTGSREAAFLRSQSEYVFWRTPDEVMVEIQWEITPRYFGFPLDIEELWKRAKTVSLAGKDIPILSPEDHLIILCVHGNKHLWERLGWICDVAELLRVHKELDWQGVMRQADALGCKRMLLIGLFLASELLGVELPLDVLRRLQAQPAVQKLGAQVRQHLFCETSDTRGMLASSLFHLRSKERLNDRVRYCLRLALTTTVGDWDLLPGVLPHSLSFLYYPIRMVRLAGKYWLGIFSGNGVRS